MRGWSWTFVITFWIGAVAGADCLSPAGVAGQVRYATPNLQFCDGYAWSSTDSSVTATSCTTAGQIKLVGSNIRFCNGSFWVDTVGSLTNGTCSTTGDLTYSPTKNWMQSCNGTNWIPLGKTAPAVTTKLAQYNSGTGLSFSLPAFSGTVAAGDAIVCRSYMATSSTVSTVTDNKGSTYTRIIGPWNDNQGLREELWVAENTPGGTSLTVSVTRSGGSGTQVMFECIDVNGVVATNVVDQFTKVSGTTDTAAGTTVTTTSARELILFATMEQNSCTAASGWSTVSSYQGDPVFSKTVSSIGSYTTPTGSGCGTTWNQMIVTLRLK